MNNIFITAKVLVYSLFSDHIIVLTGCLFSYRRFISDFNNYNFS